MGTARTLASPGHDDEKEQLTLVTTATDAPGPSDTESPAPAVTRAVALLEVLAAMDGQPAGPSELARRLGLPKSSIANICVALADAGLVRRVGTSFGLGRKLAELGGAYLATVDEVREFQEACPGLPLASDETIQLAILVGREMSYVARHDGRQPIRLASEIGRRLPASCTATGKAALALLDESDVKRRFAGVRKLPTLTPKSHRSMDALLADVREVRRRGYAIDDEETMEGVTCYALAIPARRPGADPYAASITLLKARATPERVADLLSDLRLLAAALSDPLHRISQSGPTGQGPS
jgi:DNA-binding IclR family transcriptional regulator